MTWGVKEGRERGREEGERKSGRALEALQW
jgi:hypothetical protein